MNIKNQKGMTFIGILFVLGIVAFFVLLGLRLTPMFIESTKIRGSLESLENEAFITTKNKAQVQSLLQRRFDVEDITAVTAAEFEVKKEKGILKISVEYEIRKNIMGNADVVMSYKEKVELVQN